MTGEELKQKVSDFSEVVKTFADLLRAENQALREFDVAKVSALFEQKSKISTAYRGLVAFFMKHQEELKMLDAGIKEGLRENSLELDKLFQENDLLLKTRMETSQTVVGAIVNATKMMNESKATSYGAHGTLTPLGSQSNAMAVNQTL